jgi:NAD(P)-dependent dehydrogenase (short-subunit alcohol dehydrogenase family)
MCSKDEVPKNLEEVSSLPKQGPQVQPGIQAEMTPKPLVHHLPGEEKQDDHTTKLQPYLAAGKLEGKTAIITGGDSGIGCSVATLFALEGASGITIVHLPREEEDAKETKSRIESQSKCKILLLAEDVGFDKNCEKIISEHIKAFLKIDILVNNASEQHLCESIEQIPEDQVERTFRTNIFGMIFMAKHAVKHMNKGATIINTTSVTAYKGHKSLLDYSSTKGAITAFTRSLSLQLASRGIRVNAVAPGPIWTPLIPASFKPEQIEEFGHQVPLGRPGQPSEVATCFVFLASADSSYITGQVMHPNGGTIVNS